MKYISEKHIIWHDKANIFRVVLEPGQLVPEQVTPDFIEEWLKLAWIRAATPTELSDTKLKLGEVLETRTFSVEEPGKGKYAIR